jgi:hypothetical protein
MLIRIGRVAWYIGLMFFVIAGMSLTSAAVREIFSPNLHELQDELREVQAKQSENLSRFTPKNNRGRTQADVALFLASPVDALKDAGAPETTLQEQSSLMQLERTLNSKIIATRAMAEQILFAALLSVSMAIIGAFFWCLAYVLGGHFWTPPKKS